MISGKSHIPPSRKTHSPGDSKTLFFFFSFSRSPFKKQVKKRLFFTLKKIPLSNTLQKKEMLTLREKLLLRETNNNNPTSKKCTIRDRLLVKELADLQTSLIQTTPTTITLTHPTPDKLHEFVVAITPEEGYWAKGTFSFSVFVGEEYNFCPPLVKSLHPHPPHHPNIEPSDGSVCLSLLRLGGIDSEYGWAPTRTIKDVVWGLSSLFTDLLNFDDALNIPAAELYQKDPQEYSKIVKKLVVNKK